MPDICVISRLYIAEMEKVLQILAVLALLMLAVTYYIKADKVRFRPYYPIGRFFAPNDLIWDLPGMDPDNQLMFIPANANAPVNAEMPGNAGMVEVLDSNTRELVTHIPVGADPGAQVFDPESRYLYSANGDGTVSIIRQVNRDTYKVLQTLVTRQGCRLLALDTRTKKIYLPVAGSIIGMESVMPDTENFVLPAEGTLLPKAGEKIVQPIDCWVYSNQ